MPSLFEDHSILVLVIGIATQLFREGTPVILIKGLDSYLTTQKSNENLEEFYDKSTASLTSRILTQKSQSFSEYCKTFVSDVIY